MNCHYCGKEITGKPVTAGEFNFCDNLCRRSYQKNSLVPHKEESVKKVESNVKTKSIPVKKEAVPFKVHTAERVYFGIRAFFTLLLFSFLIVLFIYSPAETGVAVGILAGIGAYLFFLILMHTAILVGYVRGSGVEISERQFPDIHKIIVEQSEKLGLAKVPKLYTVQVGGALNALAVRYVGRNYVVLFSDILETAYEEGPEALSFIIGHELGHLKRKHHLKNLLLLPSIFVPFLHKAYSRACEYSCDNIGHTLSPKGSREGIAILAVGKHLYTRISMEEFAHQLERTGGFSVWLAEILSTHPHTAKRMKNLYRQNHD